MELRILLLEGKTDVNFFLPLVEHYGFRENGEACKTLPFPRDSDLSRPICLTKGETLLIVLHAGGKDKIKKALKVIFKALNRFDEQPTIIGVARDIDTEKDILNWAKSTLGMFEPEVEDGYLVVKGIKVVPFGIGEVLIDDKNIETKKELELLMAFLAKKESTISKLGGSIHKLSEDLRKKLTPKDIVHLLAIAKNYTGDSLSGLYRNFIEELIRENPEVVEEFLDESGLKMFLDVLAG
ncbi:DUF3226 domain-containing protein [Thermococcus zilligii]|uniref:DUF3226 domain-containing protein n=1 Tax=Thermococcus zilligii TaxID=54076 RepID=UPI00029AF7E4|nr:DUF3226 domain-containing protein [Thermococcus zilligii]